MGRLFGLLYGIAAYLLFFVSFLYAIGFVAAVGVPKTIDNGTATPLIAALVIDVVLMSIFAIQHSVMARPAFKRVWTKIVPPADRAQHLRAAGDARAHSADVAMAADPRRGLAGQRQPPSLA